MNILILTLYPAPYRVALFEMLSENHNVEVFFEKDNDNRNPKYCSYSNKLNYHILGNKESDDIFKIATRNLRKYDLIMFYEYHTIKSVKLILKCIFSNVKYAINCDGVVDINLGFPKKQIKRYIIKRASLCFAGGERAKLYFETYGANSTSIFVHNFTSIYDKDINSISIEEKRMRRLEKGILGDTVSVSVGRLIKSKRFDLLIDCWKRLPNNHHLYIIGNGELQDELSQIIDNEGLTNVHLLDFLERDNLFNFLLMCDLFVFTTLTDVWGLVINEAMSKGLPVVSSNNCIAAREMIREGKNGYLISESESRQQFIQSFCNSVLMILNDEEMMMKMSAESILVAKEYTYEHSLSVVERALRTLYE